jgi:hypothetical protein
MIGEAMRAADGQIPDLSRLLAQVRDARAKAEEHPHDPSLLEALLPTRLTPLDITRPARDLLEDLVTGIHGCFLLYSRGSSEDGAGEDPYDLDDGSNDDGSNEDGVERGRGRRRAGRRPARVRRGAPS